MKSNALIKKTGMAKYKINAQIVFDGYVIVSADNRSEAEIATEKHIAAILGNIETFDDCIEDWNFNLHSTALVTDKTQEGKI